MIGFGNTDHPDCVCDDRGDDGVYHDASCPVHQVTWTTDVLVCPVCRSEDHGISQARPCPTTVPAA